MSAIGALIMAGIVAFVVWLVYEERAANQAEERYHQAWMAASAQERQDWSMGLYCPPDCGAFSADPCGAAFQEYLKKRAEIYQALADAVPRSSQLYNDYQIQAGQAWADIPSCR
jgi:hypothetical protein